MSSEEQRIRGHELVSVAAPHQLMRGQRYLHHDKYALAAGGRSGGGAGGQWAKDKKIPKNNSSVKYGAGLGKLGDGGHSISDYAYECDMSGDDVSMDDSEMDRMAPDQMDDINIEYNEIDINDLQMDMDMDNNDAMNNNDDCV